MHKVILVDDEKNVLHAVKRELSFLTKADQSAFQISLDIFDSPVEALTYAKTHPIDLVISDYRMPEMNGVDFLRNLNLIQPLTASIILSGQADMQAILRAINEVGISRFVTKPWNDVELITHVLEVLADITIKRENKNLADEMRKLLAGFETAGDISPVHAENIILDSSNLPVEKQQNT
ncbi:response regulator [Leeia sp. TBRC 13508]|uniref:Response regulator n=1 Tax=Leeia speluncae TaxID=2884804 RepID=A0ABS8D8Q1_9NEIS|nr:response regulator [Leeia speluncae]MCB6184597.1 response regulator [Leeia speluncae]